MVRGAILCRTGITNFHRQENSIKLVFLVMNHLIPYFLKFVFVHVGQQYFHFLNVIQLFKRVYLLS